MKYFRWLIIIAMMLVTIIGYTQTTYYANQVTITWDASTTYENGDLLPAGIDIYYDVYIREKGEEQIYLGETIEITYLITFPIVNKKYDIGVLAKYQIGTDWLYSSILWSIEEGWDVGFFVPASPPTNLRIE